MVGYVIPPKGYLLLDRLRFIPNMADSPVKMVTYTASKAEPVTATDLAEEQTYTAGGRLLRWQRQESELTAVFDAQGYAVTVTLTAVSQETGDRVLLNLLPVLVDAVHLNGETRAMPMDGLFWGMTEDDLTGLLGLSIYAVPLAGEGWEGLEYVTGLYGMDAAELDCCMKDGRLRMLLCGL